MTHTAHLNGPLLYSLLRLSAEKPCRDTGAHNCPSHRTDHPQLFPVSSSVQPLWAPPPSPPQLPPQRLSSSPFPPVAVGDLSGAVSEISSLQVRISDHSPLVKRLAVGPTTSLPPAPWKRNARWRSLFPNHVEVHHSITDFLVAHQGQEDLLQTWDAFKAFLCGVLIG